MKISKASKNRQISGIISGVFGIFLNGILFIIKYSVGHFSNSLAIKADAVNNLSDSLSNIISITGSILSGKPVDKEHPYGHGRWEYVSALLISFLIMYMGITIGKDSIINVFKPKIIKYQALYIIIPAISILIKLSMALYNGFLYKKTKNVNLKAAKTDSYLDCISTFVSIIALIISKTTGFYRIDGIAGMLVCIIIIVSALKILSEISGPLIGQRPSDNLINGIKNIMLQEKNITEVHDILVHDYGPGRKIASAHAEMPHDIDIFELHDSIDRAEKNIFNIMGIEMCIHIDPIKPFDKNFIYYKELTNSIIKKYDKSFSFHDFKCKITDNIIHLEFELAIPFNEKRNENEISLSLINEFKKSNENINPLIKIEKSFT